MEEQAFFGRQLLITGQPVVVINTAKHLEHIAASLRKVFGYLGYLPSPVSKTVGKQDLYSSRLRYITRERVTHLNRGGQLARPLLQYVGDVLARVFCASEEQRDFICTHYRYDAAGENACAFIVRLACQAQNPHARIIVMQDAGPVLPTR